MIEQPAQARYTVENEGSILRLIVPSRKHWFTILFLGIWSVLWLLITLTVLGSMVAGIIASARGSSGSGLAFLGLGLFFTVWLLLWIGGGLYAVYLLFWQLIGHEDIEIGPGTLSIVRRVMGFEKPKLYDVTHIKELRIAPYLPQSSWPGGYNRQMWSRNTGALAFDYGAKTIRFGDMDEAEAKMALVDILQRYPNFGRQEQKQ
jgi:hypothetical protein